MILFDDRNGMSSRGEEVTLLQYLPVDDHTHRGKGYVIERRTLQAFREKVTQNGGNVGVWAVHVHSECAASGSGGVARLRNPR